MGIPADYLTEKAVILVLHLDPELKSLLTELIQRVIIPPGFELQIVGNIFHLEEPLKP